MTFLSPVYLVALLGAAIPVLIHLLARRLAQGSEFSSLIFLKEIEQRTLRWVRMQERWLLAIRILIVVFMALALARPSCGKQRTPDSTLLVMDVSASMGATDGAVWRRALHAATAVIDGLAPEIMGVAAAGSRLHVVYSDVGRRDQINEQLEQLLPGVETLNVARVVSDAADLARDRGYQRLRLVFISDFQPTNWQEHVPCPPEIEMVGVSIEGAPRNLGFGELSLLGIAGSEHGVVELQGSVVQFGTQAADTCLVTVRWNGNEQRISLPLEGRETAFVRRLGSAFQGLAVGELVLEDREGVALDNKQAVALFVPTKQNVVIIGGEGEETRRVALALDPTGRQGSGFNVVTVGYDECETRLLDSAETIVVLQAPGPKPLRKQLVECWERGKGLVLVADSDSLTNDETAFFARVANGMPAKRARFGPGQPDMMPGEVQYEHPILAPFRNFSAAGLSLPTVWRLRGWAGEQGNTLVGLQDGVPLLIEHSSGRSGRVVVWLTGLVPPWSDWSSRASFVPLWRRTIQYACGIDGAASVPLGQESIVEFPCGGSSCVVRLEHPDGSTVELIPEDVVPPVARMSVGPFSDPGLYVIWSGDKPARLLVTTVDDGERAASLPSARPKMVERWLEYQGIGSGITGVSKKPSELTQLLVLAALGMLVTETFFAARASGKATPNE